MVKPMPPVLARELDNGLGQRSLIIVRLPLVALRGARLAQHPTHPSFREAQRRTAWVTVCRRRAGLRSFPRRLPCEVGDGPR